ncbi:hypothetical protein LAZ67_16002075 [Cordylochernes scorpioides]|uniref:Uncharacterized protein n=1 Tax=Cordylochernes scorpioides TaxID=51811 RepID=A0ABY6LEA2_9ARAC|nr:hypothetical protein LAZ67_16002075 [Cordylochernes scorpioides]
MTEDSGMQRMTEVRDDYRRGCPHQHAAPLRRSSKPPNRRHSETSRASCGGNPHLLLRRIPHNKQPFFHTAISRDQLQPASAISSAGIPSRTHYHDCPAHSPRDYYIYLDMHGLIFEISVMTTGRINQYSSPHATWTLGEGEKEPTGNTVAADFGSRPQMTQRWTNGKRRSLKFGVPMIWRESRDHTNDCYFCTLRIVGITEKIATLHQYVHFLTQLFEDAVASSHYTEDEDTWLNLNECIFSRKTNPRSIILMLLIISGIEQNPAPRAVKQMTIESYKEREVPDIIAILTNKIDELGQRLENRLTSLETGMKRNYTQGNITISDWQKFYEKLLDAETIPDYEPLAMTFLNTNNELTEHITLNEINREISRLRCGKATGFDEIVNEEIKTLLEEYLISLKDIFKRILRTSEFPKTWLKSVIQTNF